MPAFLDGDVEQVQRVAHGLGEAVRLGGRRHAATGSHEERILIEEAQPLRPWLTVGCDTPSRRAAALTLPAAWTA